MIMKIFFSKDHSLYKIFKTLEKVPENKTIHIYIEPEHAFFENERRGKQIQEVLEQKKLNAFFITRNERTKRFFEKIGLKVIHQEQNKILKYLNLTYLFIFNIKKFHLSVYNKKNFIFYIISAFEVAFIMGILYLLYTLILPSATITITPAHQVEPIIYNFRYYPNTQTDYPANSRYLSIPYYSGYIDYKYDMTINASHLKHILNPSKGKIKIYNTTNKEYSIVPNTRFITNDGLLFQNTDRFKLFPGTEDKPGETVVTVRAMEKDINNIFIGARGNIPKGTPLYIKNLKNSFYLKKIYARSIEDFTGGSLNSQGLITQQDINSLSGRLVEYIHKQKLNIIRSNFKIKDSILLAFDKITDLEIKTINIQNKPGEKSPELHGYIIARIYFKYIQSKDLHKAIEKYLDQRPSEKVRLINIDTNSLSFFTENIKNIDNIIVLPTKINVIQGYDFQTDINNVIDAIKNDIINKSKQEAKNIILSFPETAGVSIKITPLRYNRIPQLKSRIKIETKKS